MIKRSLWMLPAAVLLLAVSFGVERALAQDFGFGSKKPIIGGACPYCPWGALADKVKLAMKPLGYDVQICYNCSGIDSIRMVAERRKTFPLAPDQLRDRPAPPNGEVDFGVVNLDFLVDAYRGTGRYKPDGPRPNLRLIATVQDPSYYLVATRADALISDLHQIRERKIPVRILSENSIRSEMILSYYGITRKEVESWGGSITTAAAENRHAYDVVISFANGLNNTPESNVWYELSQKGDLRFIQLPDDLLNNMAKASEWEIGTTPVRMLRGMDTPVKTILTSGTVVYGRADMPDQFTYDAARALDEQKHVLIFSLIAFSYDPARVWQARGVPLHPGAERYYREKGYMPKMGN